MPTQTVNAIWTIPVAGAHGPNPGGPQTALVGCHLAIVTDANGTHYQFQNAGKSGLQTSTGASLPPLPYIFQVFNSQLGGPNALNWYIKIENTLHGQNEKEAHGAWSNVPFTTKFEETDTDTWTAQAGSGGTMGDDTEETAAVCAKA